ncbi:hypothetical protein [Sphingobacterium sp.]|uniref:hypothetical protein n=1 Tax=Sphingobacterium sp. TaxID=341027 RepID=UPI0031D92AAC
MKKNIIVFMNIVLFNFLVSCATTVNIGDVGKYSYKSKNDKSLEKDKVGISIQLFDFQSKKEIDISDVKPLPGILRDSTFNSKLFLFDKNDVPLRIDVKKRGKAAIPIIPKFGSKNLLIFKLYLVSSEPGIL